MEAMALGLPCISTDCDGGGARFLIEDGKNGLLVPKENAEQLADAMRRCLADQQFMDQLGNRARDICDRLSAERIYSEWEAAINRVVKE
jgi:glycosyltransferase involved in cell wall biosynthesis